MTYRFQRPQDVSSIHLDQIHQLIIDAGKVGTSYIAENLRNAFLIGYTLKGDRVIAGVTLKNPKEEYRRRIEEATDLNLTGYLERGYTTVVSEFKNRGIPHKLIQGLCERSRGLKIYVTIRMDNIPALKLAAKNGMSLAAQFLNQKTGHKIGVFTNQGI
jgi:hypothetical protein